MTEMIAMLLWSGIDFLLVLTGKILVTTGSLGRWRGERLSCNESRIYGAAGALSFTRDGQRVVTSLGLVWIGALFYVLLALLLIGCFAST